MRYFRPGFICRPPLYVSWNPQDKTDNVSLSGGNLTAAANAGGDGGVRSTLKHVTSKWYAEISVITLGGGDSALGVASPSAGLSVIGNVAALAMLQFRSGNTYKNGSLLFGNGNMGGGGVWQVCYDGTAHRTWFKFAAGNWNANAANDPATGVGGQDVSAFDSLGLYLVFAAGASGDTVVLNAGGSSFTYSAPSGFGAWNTGTG